MSRRLLAPLLAVALVPAAGLADPLRAIPKSATVVAHVENPRKLIEAVTALDLYGKYEALPQVKQLVRSPQAKRAFQFVAHVEKALGARWPDVLDKLAGGGVALGADPNADPAPAVLVMEGKDEKGVGEGFELAVQLIEAELARQSGGETPVKLPRGTHAGATTVSLGEFQLARAGRTILVASSVTLLHDAIGRVAAKTDPDSVLTAKGFRAAKALIGPNPLASLWVNLRPVKETTAGRDFFEATRKDFLQTVVVGSSIDAVRRSDFVAVGLHETPKGFKLSVRLPAKRDGLPNDFGMHVPMSTDTLGTLPLLEPPGVLYSQSLHLDLAALWKDRKTLFNEQILGDIEKGVRDVSRLLPGTSVEKLLAQSGPHHRFVVVERGADQYAVRPGTVIPEMALVSTTRHPDFAAGMGTTLRAAGLLASLQLKLKMTEESADGVRITSYRFPDKGEFPGDDGNLRFNFVPCFAATEKEFLVGTSPRLLKDLLAELKKPARPADTSAAVWRGKFYGTGAATAIRSRPDAVISDAVLSRGVGLKQAKAEVAELAAFLDAFGTVSFALDHGKEAFKFDVEWERSGRK
jgi:hypothetical protein